MRWNYLPGNIIHERGKDKIENGVIDQDDERRLQQFQRENWMDIVTTGLIGCREAENQEAEVYNARYGNNLQAKLNSMILYSKTLSLYFRFLLALVTLSLSFLFFLSLLPLLTFAL